MAVLAEQAIYVFGVIINVLAMIVDMISTGVEVLSQFGDGLSILATGILAVAAAWGIYTIYTKAAAFAQGVLNLVQSMSPMQRTIMIIIAIVTVILLLTTMIANLTGVTQSGLGIITGAFAVAGAFIANLAVGLLDIVIGVLNTILGGFAVAANFVGNIFNDPVASIIYLFEGMAQTILSILGGIASAIDRVFGSNLSSAVGSWSDGLSSKADELASKYGNGTYNEAINFEPIQNPLGDWRLGYGDAWKAGADFGDGISDKIKNTLTGGSLNPENYDLGLGNVAANVDDIAGDTGSMKNALDISEENLEYLRDIAERDAINKFTTASVRVEMVNNNNVAADADLDGIIDGLATRTEDALMRIAEGV